MAPPPPSGKFIDWAAVCSLNDELDTAIVNGLLEDWACDAKIAPPDSPAEFWIKSVLEMYKVVPRDEMAPPCDPVTFAALLWKRHPGPIEKLPAERRVMAPPLPLTLLLINML